MNRKDKIIQHIDPNGKGLEIGPGYNPAAPKINGFDVESIDHMCREDLVEKYTGHPGVDTDKIEEVDFVWQGESYAELTGKQDFYDWIIASHLVEHTPDFIGFLNDCDTVLKDTGIISLAVPDKRYCFDYFRPITSLSAIIDAHLNRSRVHTPGRIAEYYLDGVSRGGNIAWDENSRGDFELRHNSREAEDRFHSAVDGNQYDDIHSWCFVPHSFRLIIHDLYNLGLIQLKEIDFHLSEGYEFFITLGRQGKGIGISRLEMLKIIQDEIEAGCRRGN